MSLNDNQERLDLAGQYLLDYPASSQEFEAALEHVRWVHANQPDLRTRCEQILAATVVKRRDDKNVIGKLRKL